MQLVSLMSRKPEKRKPSCLTGIVDAAAAALEQLKTQQIWQLIATCLAFSLYDKRGSRVRMCVLSLFHDKEGSVTLVS